MLLVPRETRQQQTRRPLSGPTANKYDTLFWLQPKHSGLILNMSRCIGEMHLTPPPSFHQNPVSGVRCILRDNCMNSWIIQRFPSGLWIWFWKCCDSAARRFVDQVDRSWQGGCRRSNQIIKFNSIYTILAMIIKSYHQSAVCFDLLKGAIHQFCTSKMAFLR